MEQDPGVSGTMELDWGDNVVWKPSVVQYDEKKAMESVF